MRQLVTVRGYLMTFRLLFNGEINFYSVDDIIFTQMFLQVVNVNKDKISTKKEESE